MIPALNDLQKSNILDLNFKQQVLVYLLSAILFFSLVLFFKDMDYLGISLYHISKKKLKNKKPIHYPTMDVFLILKYLLKIKKN